MCRWVKQQLVWFVVVGFVVCSVPAWAAKEEPKQKGQEVKQAVKVKESEPELKGVKIDSSVIQAIEALSAKDPTIALRLYYIAGEGYQAQNQPDRAIAIYESAIKVFPKQEEDLLGRLVSLYQQQSKYDQVIEVASRLAKLRPDNLYYQQMVANAHFAKGDKDKGIAAWKAVIAAHQDDANLLVQFAQVLQGQGKSNEALEQFKAAATLKPQETSFAQQLGQAYINNQKWDEAKQVYEKLISTAKDTWVQKDAGRQLLNIAMQQKTLDALLTSTEVSLAKDPANLSAHWQLIEGYSMSGKSDELLAALERAVKQFPEDRELSSRLISSYQMQGKWDKAIEILKEQVTKNPKDTGLRTQLAQTQANAGQVKEAIATFEEAAANDPNNAMMYGEQIAEVYARANQFDEAIKQFETLKAKATEDWRKTNYSSRIEQLKLQKQQPEVKPASQPAAVTPAVTSAPPVATTTTPAPTVSAPASAEEKEKK